MLGDQLASMAISNHWEGILINGLIRDSEQINQMDISVRALGVHPLKSVKRGIGETNLVLSFSGVNFTPDEYLYADQDGIVVVKEKVEL
jgi:regulator of ribonuclease activity A